MPSEDTPPTSPHSAEIMEGEENTVEVILLDEDIFDSDSDDEDSSDARRRSEPDEALNDDHAASALEDDSDYVFAHHSDSIYSCQLEPKTGNLAVTGSGDDKALVWDVRTGDIFMECKGHEDSVMCVEFNHDGTYVATGDMNGMIKVWKVSSKSVVWETNVGELSWLTWHHGSNVLLGGMVAGEVFVWRLPGGECKMLPGHGSKTECGLLMPDGRRLAVGYEDGCVKVFDVKSTNVLHCFAPGQAHSGAVVCMDSHPDNNLLVTSSTDGTAAVITTQTGKIASVLNCAQPGVPAEDSEVECVSFVPDSPQTLVITGTLNGTVSVWDISRETPRYTHVQDAGITKFLWAKDGIHVVVGCVGGEIGLLDVRTCTLKRQLGGHQDNILDMALSPDGKLLLTASDDTTARVYNMERILAEV